MGKHEDEERRAKQVGYSRSTLRRLTFIREAAENEDLPAQVRDVAKAHYARAFEHGFRVMPAYEAVMAAWREHGVVWVGTCPVCGTTFEGRRPDARYCSSACRQRAHRGT